MFKGDEGHGWFNYHTCPNYLPWCLGSQEMDYFIDAARWCYEMSKLYVNVFRKILEIAFVKY